MSYSILVVDDEADNFEVIEALLTNTEYTLHYANRGREAIADLDKFAPDIILLDVMMPDIDGIEVCRQIKAMPQWQAVPIIMVTALAETADLARCIATGADDFVSKPINGVELRARVQSMLRIKKQHDRIQSLSKLQRNNIHFLENSLHELQLDLAVSFPKELNAPLSGILENIFILRQDFKEMTDSEIDGILESVNRSTLKIDKLNQSFLFYLQLNLPSKDPIRQSARTRIASIEQLVSSQVRSCNPLTKLVVNVEDAELAITSSHLQYIVIESLDYILKPDDSDTLVNINGSIIDGLFHLCFDNLSVDSSKDISCKLSELIQFNSGLDVQNQELGIGLKIVKKIIEIYDGLFLIANSSQDERTIYVTLPLPTLPHSR